MGQAIGLNQNLNAQQTKSEPHVAATIGLWALKLGIAGIFVMAGSGKLSGAEQMVQMFDAIGMGQWFRFFTGATEIVSAALLLIPATAGVGALLAVSTMAGAILTHIFVVGGSFAMPAGLLAAALIVLYANRNQMVNLVRKVRGA
jgi:putative oxidoreductase